MIEATIWIDPVTLTQVHYDPHGEYGDSTPGDFHAGWGFVEALEFTVRTGRVYGRVYLEPDVPSAVAGWHRKQPQRVLANLYEGWDQELGSWPPYGVRRYPDGDRMTQTAEDRGLDNFARAMRQEYVGALRQRLDFQHEIIGKTFIVPIERDDRPRNWWGR